VPAEASCRGWNASESRGRQHDDRDLEILYTAAATAEAGREGHARTSDGRLEVDLDVPSEMGGTGGPGTNPEQLFRRRLRGLLPVGAQPLRRRRKLDLAGSRIIARFGNGLLSTGGLGQDCRVDPQRDLAQFTERIREPFRDVS
jgi:hypothetical protein